MIKKAAAAILNAVKNTTAARRTDAAVAAYSRRQVARLFYRAIEEKAKAEGVSVAEYASRPEVAREIRSFTARNN